MFNADIYLLKARNNTGNLFKVHNKDARTNSIKSFSCLVFLLLTVNKWPAGKTLLFKQTDERSFPILSWNYPKNRMRALIKLLSFSTESFFNFSKVKGTVMQII